MAKVLLLFSICAAVSIASHGSVVFPQCRQLRCRIPSVNDMNSPHIFNSIADGMRQWGESLHFNGMSLFLAAVPQGTELYRGTTLSEPVKHLQWLAFEPEHALGVVRGRTSNHTKGYLHTYRTTQTLRFIYIDGQSAAKTDKGCLDTQDFVIRDASKPPAEPPPGALPPGALGDSERAEEMCKIAAGAWHSVVADKISGFIRMQGGFEVILCGVSRLPLRVVRIDPLTVGNEVSQMDFYTAVATRYDGIGMGRVTLDYEHMLPLWAYGDLVRIDHNGFPRVNNGSVWLRSAKRDLRNLARRNFSRGHDWQGRTDMIQLRYSDRIQFLASGAVSSVADLRRVADQLMDPFIDYEHRDTTKEIRACATQFWPEDLKCGSWCSRTSLAAQAVGKVAQRICSTFSKATTANDAKVAVREFEELKTWLDWATFKRCRGCAVNAMCVVPIWPLGTNENFRQPSCYSSLAGLTGGRDSFWFG